jgi:hypothetical protein
MKVTFSLLFFFLLALSATADDTPIAVLGESLTSIVRNHYPDAQIEVTEKSYTATYASMDFTVPKIKKGGDTIASESTVMKGPSYKGFLLKINAEARPVRSQAALPVTFYEFRWHTYVDRIPIKTQNQHLLIRFSYGSEVPSEFLEAILHAIPKSTPRG